MSGPDSYQLFPELSAEEFAALKADVAAHGVLVPVEVDEAGQLLDGHHRVRAWTELRGEGLRLPPYPRVVRRFGSEDERFAHVLGLNLARGHLSSDGRRQLEGELRARGWSTRRIATAVGVGKSTVAADLADVRNRAPATAPEVVVGADGKSYPTCGPRGRPSVVVASTRDQRRAQAALRALGEEAPPRLLGVRRAEELGRTASLGRRRAADPAPVAQGPGWRIECCDFRELDVEDASIDAIVCDPPYTLDALALWPELSAWAPRVLKPGRLLVAYAGKLALPTCLEGLGKHLEYVWTGATFLPGRHSIIRARMVRAHWRPWLVFSAGPYRPRSWLLDATTAEGRGEKAATDHPWRQTVGPFSRIIEMVSMPGELVVDPFVGQGTTAVAAVGAARRFLGCDVDAGAVSLAREALEAPA